MARGKVLVAFILTGLAVAGGFYLEKAVASAAPATAPAAAKSAAPAKPLSADGYRVRLARLEETVPANGTLAPKETVEIVAELSRRLVKINAEEGATVKAGDLLFKLDDADLKAQLEEREVRRRLAAGTESRLRDLLAAKAISQQQYDEAKNALDLVDAETNLIRVTLAKTEVRAPFDGILGSRSVSEGAWIDPNKPLITLQALSTLKLNFTLPERYGNAVQPNQAVTFQVQGLAGDRKGRVVFIEPAIDEATRSLRVRAEVENTDGRLRPGAFVTVLTTIRATDEGVMIPSESVVPSLKGQSVFIAVDGKVATRVIETGIRTADSVQVLRGLAPEEVVLTTNLLRLRPGAAVELKTIN